MCNRCRVFTLIKARPGEIHLGERRRDCRCQKQCDRLIEGKCADCGHFVEHS